MSDIELKKACNRHIITDSERGHRPPISKHEKSERYSIRLPMSLWEKARALGADKVREILKAGLK